MPTAATCPNCGAPLSEASVLALAPVCGNCKTVITNVGGTLGLTAAYGVNDATITRRRVESDLSFLCGYIANYKGMMAACKEELKWGVERYARLPVPPELLPLQPVPPFWDGLSTGLRRGFVFGMPCCCLTCFPVAPLLALLEITTGYETGVFRDQAATWDGVAGYTVAALITNVPWYAIWVFFALLPHIKAKAANGDRPRENARRQSAYEQAYAAAIRVAEPIKAAQDHRLRTQIRELEGLIETVGGKAENVREILATL